MTREEAFEEMKGVADGWRDRIERTREHAKALRTLSEGKPSVTRNQCESLAEQCDRSALQLASKLLALSLILSMEDAHG